MASRELVSKLFELGGVPPANYEEVPDEEIEALIEAQLIAKFGGESGDLTALSTTDSQQVMDALYTTDVANPQTLSDDELMNLVSTNNDIEFDDAVKEQQMRELTDNRNFFQNLTDPATSSYTAGRMGGQVAGGALNAINLPANAAGVYGLVGSGVEIAGENLIQTITGAKEPVGIDLGSSAALEFAAEEFEKTMDLVGVGQPRNIEESLANIAGGLIPIPGVKAPTSVVGNALEVVTPFVYGASVPRLAVNAGVGIALDQTVRELSDDSSSDYTTAFDALGFGDIEKEDNEGLNPWAIAALGGVATISLTTPMLAQVLHSNKLKAPRIEEIKTLDSSGPTNLFSLETAGDLYKTYGVDEKQVLMDIAERSGVPNFDQLRMAIDLDTQMAGLTKVNEGVLSGVMRSQYGDFVSPVAPKLVMDTYKQLPADMQADFDNYMKLGDYADDLRLQVSTGKGRPTAATELAAVQAQRDLLRQKHPTLPAFSRQYQEVTEAARDFMTKGPYGLLSTKAKQGLDLERKHYVPNNPDWVDPTDTLFNRIAQTQKPRLMGDADSWLMKRDFAAVNGVDNRRQSIDAMIDYTSAMLNAQLQNNVRGVYIDQLLKSAYNDPKKPLIRLAKEGEASKYPTRVVEIVRNGKKEQYLIGELQAQLLKFDPYMVNNPILAGIYGSRRLAEKTTTGVLSLTFAPTTAIRDTMAGWSNAKTGQKGPSIIGTATAPVEILSAKMLRAMYQTVSARLNANNPLPFVNPQAQQQLAARLASTYQGTLYHLAQETGGFDASLMKDRIEAGKGTMRELARSMPSVVSKTYGRTLKPIFAGFNALFDSIQEAPRYAAFKREYLSGRPIEEAVSIARNITGDTMRSGRVYDPAGRRITADAVNKGATAFSNVGGALIEATRLGVPYVNPAIQGLRRAYISASADPVRFAMRNWLTVGVPAIAGYAWNNMLSEDDENGYDYNRYAFEMRPSRDQVMEMYFGIPGLPPEQGISIPIAHEQALFMSPYLTLLHQMGSSDDEIASAITHNGLTILENVGGLQFPTLPSVAYNLSGYKAPEALLAPWKNTYELTEDNVGLFSQNIEQAIRTQFGPISQTALDTMYAFVQDGDLAAAAEEFTTSLVERSPIIKGVSGHKKMSTYFTPLAAEQRKKLDAYYQFEELWDAHFKKDMMVREEKLPAGPLGMTMDTPLARTGPLPTPKPINPLYELFGEQIRNAMEKNGDGMLNIKARQAVLTKQVHLLTGYNAGRQKDYEEHQKLLEQAPEKLVEAEEVLEALESEYDVLTSKEKKSDEGKELKGRIDDARENRWEWDQQVSTLRLIEENDIDLGNRLDVTRLINLLEKERFATMEQQLTTLRQIEDRITEQMVSQGLIAPGQRFLIERDLAPMKELEGQ